MEKLELFNGNDQKYNIDLPKLHILTDHVYNDVALNHIEKNTGLVFTPACGGMSTQPETCEQIAKLFLTYNFKTQYHNNATNKNTLFLKNDHHTGFKVDSICYSCCKENNINANGLTPADRLSC